jgi:hypothetical protein
MDIAMGISLICFGAVLLFNVYEFSRISKRMAEEHGKMIERMEKSFERTDSGFKEVSDNLIRVSEILDRIDSRIG